MTSLAHLPLGDNDGRLSRKEINERDGGVLKTERVNYCGGTKRRDFERAPVKVIQWEILISIEKRTHMYEVCLGGIMRS